VKLPNGTHPVYFPSPNMLLGGVSLDEPQSLQGYARQLDSLSG
jgi:hypothetical protein